ncbi:MAG: hypothetical protein E3J56_08800 [Candidatus Aminicenantes bacterium]|nr:MAG: hypothetical protein E3J56_08800 [Candidatus Aminicenantes bacterium]
MTSVEDLTQSLGRELFTLVRKETGSIIRPFWWKEKAIMWFARDDNLRTQMLRFVDVFPVLQTTAERNQHMREYLIQGLPRTPPLFRIADALGRFPIGANIVASVAEQGVKTIGQHFIVGPTPEEVLIAIRKLQKEGASYTLDILGEAVLSEYEADEYMGKYISFMEQLSSPDYPRINLSVKLSALSSQSDPEAIKNRLRKILRVAKKIAAPVTLDAEQSQYRDMTINIFMGIFDEEEFKDFEGAGIAMHSYFLDSEQKIREVIDWAKGRATPILVRLVKGAYWDSEITTAVQKGWPIPVYREKWQTDMCFERCTDLLLENCDVIRLAVASHNIRSIAQAMAKASILDVPRDRLEFQVLLGMGDRLKKAILRMGNSVRVYIASGELLPGMGYLVRRIIENTSQTGFLFQSLGTGVAVEELLKSPQGTMLS